MRGHYAARALAIPSKMDAMAAARGAACEGRARMEQKGFKMVSESRINRNKGGTMGV